ncbi:MAG: methyltransferase family protein [Pseudomonadota bacterium]|jgi:protein-S-isoprenylcysteine O-methyltransferase Ste14
MRVTILRMHWLENRIPPPFVGIIFAVLMLWVAWAIPSLDYAAMRVIVAAVLAVAGLGVIASAILEFRRASTTVDPRFPSKASTLVQSGIFNRSRNPMYLGLTLILTAWALYLANLLALVLAALFVVYLNRFQIAPEERALQERFGAAYEEYKARVGRWL